MYFASVHGIVAYLQSESILIKSLLSAKTTTSYCDTSTRRRVVANDEYLRQIACLAIEKLLSCSSIGERQKLSPCEARFGARKGLNLLSLI
jgi:hypothetical protein